ncbi:MAG: hypothetical protein SWZ49_12400, partial [Cyanobacteriota bacterium]|nr:hypothetical protein [Cyanobacteriota bacterium]
MKVGFNTLPGDCKSRLHKQNPPARVVNSLVHGGGETSLGCRFPSPKLANPKGLCLCSSGF